MLNRKKKIEINVFTQSQAVFKKIHEMLNGIPFPKKVVHLQKFQNRKETNSGTSIWLIDPHTNLQQIGSIINHLLNLNPSSRYFVLLEKHEFNLFCFLIRQGIGSFLNTDTSPSVFQFEINNAISWERQQLNLPFGFEDAIIDSLAREKTNIDIELIALDKTLTEKEQKVLHMLSMGNTYEDSAAELGMKIDSLRYYIKKIYKKLGVNNKVQALQKLKSFNRILMPQNLVRNSG